MEAGKVIAVLRKCYVEQTVDDDVDELWAVLLPDVDYDEGMQAAKEHMRSEKFFPKPAEMLDLVIADRKHRALSKVEILPQKARPPLGPDQYYAYDGTVITAHQETEEERAARHEARQRALERMR